VSARPVRTIVENMSSTGIRCVRGLDIKAVRENKFFVRVQVNITVFWYVSSRNSIGTCPDVEENFCFHLQSALKIKAVIFSSKTLVATNQSTRCHKSVALMYVVRLVTF
jgi:hypothetical protein